MEKIYNQFDIETIQQLADIVKKNELSEITIVDGGKTITIKGKKCSPPAPMLSMPPMMANVQQNEVITMPATECVLAETICGNPVKSPIVGTYYEAPAPDKPPFVMVGSKVNKGDVICIVESMKLMNEITSEFSGTVKSIITKSGEPVEFGQTLMIIE